MSSRTGRSSGLELGHAAAVCCEARHVVSPVSCFSGRTTRPQVSNTMLLLSLQMGACRHLSRKAKVQQPSEEGERQDTAASAQAQTLEAGAARVSKQLESQGPMFSGDLREASNAYGRARKRRKTLQKKEASEEMLAEADAAVQESREAFMRHLNDPANAEQREAYLVSKRKTMQKIIRNGPAQGVTLAPDPLDLRVHPLKGSDEAAIEDYSIAEAHRRRERAQFKLLMARKSGATANVLALLEAEKEARKEGYQARFDDPRNAQEREEIVEKLRVYQADYHERNKAKVRARHREEYRARKRRQQDLTSKSSASR